MNFREAGVAGARAGLKNQRIPFDSEASHHFMNMCLTAVSDWVCSRIVRDDERCARCHVGLCDWHAYDVEGERYCEVCYWRPNAPLHYNSAGLNIPRGE